MDATADPVIDKLLPIVKKAEQFDPSNPVSPKGAVGPYQVMPATALALGHDPNPTTLAEPDYNEQVARSALADQIKQHGSTDTAAILAGYNASPPAIAQWKASGPPGHRNDALLPAETQKYIKGAGFASAAQPAPVQPGAAWEAAVTKARAGGYSWDDIADYRDQQTAKAKAAGYTPQQINEYFGQGEPAPLIAKMRAREEAYRAQEAADAAPKDNSPFHPEFMADNSNPATAFIKSVQSTPVGRTLNFMEGLTPKEPYLLPQNAPLATRIASDAGWFLGQAPETILALMTPGGAVSKAAAAFALPAFTRNEFSVALDQGQVSGPADYAARQAGAIWATAKAGATGAAMAAGGIAAGAGAGFLGAPALLGATASAATELSVMTGLGAALEGKLPSKEDWIDNTILLLGFKGAAKFGSKTYQIAKKNLMTHWAQSGEDMGETVEKAQDDHILKQQLTTDDPSLWAPPHPDDSVTKDGSFQISRSAGDLNAQHLLDVATLQRQAMEAVAKPKDVRTDEERAAKEANRQAYLASKKTGAPLPAGVDAWSVVGDRIATNDDARPLGERIKDTAYQIYLETQDPSAPLRSLMAAVGEGEPLEDAKNPEFLHRLAENSFTKALSTLKFGPVDEDGNKLGPGMEEIFDRFKPGEDTQKFREYAASRWATDLAERGIESGIDPDAAAAVVKEGGAHYEKSFQDLVEFQNHTLTPLVRNGIISEASRDAMIEANKAHIFGFREGVQARNVPGAPSGGAVGAGSTTKELKGSDLQIRPIEESIIKATIRRTQLADQIAANNAARDAAEPLGLAVAGKSKNLALTGVDKWMAGTDEGDDALAKLANHHLQADEIPTFANGAMTPYVFADPNMARTLRGYNTATLSTWNKLMSSVTKIQRNLITLNPLFPLKIFTYDVPFQAITNPENRNVLASIYTGMKTMFSDPAAHEAWFRSGGADHVFDVASKDAYIKQQLKGSGDPAFADRVWNVVKSPYQALQTWSRVINQVIPLGRYVRGKAAGEADERAAFASQDAKFHRPGAGGPYAKALNALQPFTTAYLNGLEKTWKAGTGFDLAGNRVMSGQEVFKNHAMATALVTLPMLANWWENKDEAWYKTEHSWKKDNGLYIPVGDGIHMYVKLPPIISFVYGAMPKMLMEKYYADNPHAFDHFWQDAVGTFAPPGGLINYNLALPAVEHIANYSFFRGSPIVTDAEKKNLPAEQYNPYTTETAKELGRITGMAPAVLDNYIDDLLPGMGIAGIKLGEKLAGVKNNPPDWHIEDWPLISSWLARHGPTASAEPIQDFRAKMSQVEQVHNSAITLMQANDYEGFKALLQKYPREAAALKYAIRGEPAAELPADTSRYEALMNAASDKEPEATQDMLAAAKELKDWELKARYVGSIKDAKELPPAEKQQLLDQIYSKMQSVAEAGQKAGDKAGFK